jgi:hypothetical protein
VRLCLFYEGSCVHNISNDVFPSQWKHNDHRPACIHWPSYDSQPSEELDHLEYLEHRTNSQQHLKKKNASEEKHHSEDLLHPGIKLFFLAYVILVTILVTKFQTIEPMQRT